MEVKSVRAKKSTPITFWKKLVIEKLNEASGEVEKKTIMFLRHFSVFNSDQADAIEGGVFKLPKVTVREGFEPLEAAEEILTGYFGREGAPALVVSHDGQQPSHQPLTGFGSPLGSPSTQPKVSTSTAFHEATHSTGHTSRLKRDGVGDGHPFGSAMYAKEELVAEMGSAFLCGQAGINNEIEASAAYIENWLGALRNDKKLLIGAAEPPRRLRT